jgi:electron transport complex protein RnfD
VSQEPKLLLTTSPFLKQEEDTAFIMWQVNLALIPVVAASVFFFGLGALLVTVAATAGAVLPEWLADRERNTIKDGSAIITGVLLAMTLPPTVPLWMAFIGGAVAILLGKLVFGGIGYSVLNPALVGRAFLQAAFPETMTGWSAQVAQRLDLSSSLFALPLMHGEFDAITAATPLASMKFDGQATPFDDLLFGTTAGSLGETSALIILLCGLYLVFRRIMNWRIPVSIFLSVAAISLFLSLIVPGETAGPLFHLSSGGLMLGAVFMATDPVTSPITQKGCWVFGAGIGILVVIIREFGGLPEGVMYAILLMNAVTPLINRVTQARVYGTGRRTQTS